MYKLPRMDDPLGQHWKQPKNLRDLVTVYETHAVLPTSVFLALPNYSSTFPSGVYPGKVWRSGPKFLRWYGPEKNGKCRACLLRVLLI